MRKIIFILVMIYSAGFLLGCKPPGDTKEDLGIKNTNVMAAGVARTWAASPSGSVEIHSDSTFFDFTCGRAGQVVYISESVSCPQGFSRCGSMTFSVSPFQQSRGCASNEKVVCMYFMVTSQGPSVMTLRCSDSQSSFNLDYQEI